MGAEQKLKAAWEQKMAQEWKAARELEVVQKWMDYQHPSHAPLYRNHMEAGEQNGDAKVDDELLI